MLPLGERASEWLGAREVLNRATLQHPGVLFYASPHDFGLTDAGELLNKLGLRRLTGPVAEAVEKHARLAGRGAGYLALEGSADVARRKIPLELTQENFNRAFSPYATAQAKMGGPDVLRETVDATAGKAVPRTNPSGEKASASQTSDETVVRHRAIPGEHAPAASPERPDSSGFDQPLTERSASTLRMIPTDHAALGLPMPSRLNEIRPRFADDLNTFRQIRLSGIFTNGNSARLAVVGPSADSVAAAKLMHDHGSQPGVTISPSKLDHSEASASPEPTSGTQSTAAAAGATEEDHPSMLRRLGETLTAPIKGAFQAILPESFMRAASPTASEQASPAQSPSSPQSDSGASDSSYEMISDGEADSSSQSEHLPGEHRNADLAAAHEHKPMQSHEVPHRL